MVTPGDPDATVRLRDVLRVLRPHRRLVAVAVTVTVAASGLGLVQPLLVMQVIEAARLGPVLWGMVALLVALFAGEAILQAFTRYLLARTGEGVVLGLRLRLVDHLLRLRIPVYDRYRIGDLISRTGTDSAALRRAIAQGFTDAVAGAVGVVGAVALMIWLDWLLFLVVVALVAGGAGLVLSVLRGIRLWSLRTQQATGEMTADLDRALSAVRTIRANRAEQREAERIGRQARSAHDAGVRMARLDAVVGPASELAVSGSFLAVLLVGGMRVASGSASFAELVAFLLYMTYLAGPVGGVFQAVSAVQQGVGALERINEVLALPREHSEAPAAAGEQEAEAATGAEDGAAPPAAPILEFRDVWFSYERDRPVLRGVSFHVPRRGRVALIGPSGTGKSTVFALAERFYDPEHGRILFDGSDLGDMGREEYRSRIGLVEQHCPILHGTLRDNLLYAAGDGREVDEGRIERVLELANLTELVARLPLGLETAVGEHGMMLSGGERQRLAIARALLDLPSLLLLDEPTAHLDAANEAALGRAIEQVSSACALLVIAHRFSTVRAADRIMVLNDGRIEAVGDHDELLATSEYYRGIAEADASIGTP